VGGLIPLSDASRRPAWLPVVTAFIIAVNVAVFLLELMRGNAFVMQWSAIPEQIISGHGWITVLTAMFMHGSWSHIIGNMVFLWAFGPEIKDAMWSRSLSRSLSGWRSRSHACPDLGRYSFHSSESGRKRSHCCGDGPFVVTYPRDRIKAVLFIFVFVKIAFIPAALLIGFWFLTQLVHAGTVAQVQTGGVAYLAHVGGFVFGALTGRLFEASSRMLTNEE